MEPMDVSVRDMVVKAAITMDESEAGLGPIDKLASSLDSELSAAVTKWLEGEDHSLASWRLMLASVLKKPLVAHLEGGYSDSLMERGIVPASEEAAALVVARALSGTADLRRRVLDAPATTSLTAAFSLGALIGRVHQNGIIQSIVRKVQDVFSGRSVEQTEGYTGFRRWVVNSSRSRHPELDGEIRGPGETFHLAPGVDWEEPRQDITVAHAASGCLCSLEYQFIDQDGNEVWR